MILALKPPISTLEQALASRSKSEKFRRLKRIQSIYVEDTKLKKPLLLKNKGRKKKTKKGGEEREQKSIRILTLDGFLPFVTSSPC